MPFTKIIHAATAAFKEKLTEFYHKDHTVIDAELSADRFRQLSTGLLESCQQAGVAGLSEYLQQKDTKRSQIEESGKRYRYKGRSSKELLTMFGAVQTRRFVYGDEEHGGEYYVPLDRALGLCKTDSATLEVREMVLYMSAQVTPEEVETMLGRYNLCKPSRTAIQNIINRDGRAIEEQRECIETEVLEKEVMPEETKAVVTSLDGGNVLLRIPGKKKGRTKNRPGGEQYRDSKTSYHTAMVGSVSYYGQDEESQPLRLGGTYTARMPQDGCALFKQDFERQLQSVEEKIAASGRQITKVLLSDGHLMIKGYAKECPYLVGYERLIDFYHVSEHLSNAAEAMYGSDKHKSQWWYTKWRTALKEESGAAQRILGSMREFRKRENLSAARLEALDTEITFFTNNRRWMNYVDFIQRGLPIGSGPIEAAVKTILKQRMCRSGMHWSVQKGQYILTLRAYVKSGLWDKIWNSYCKMRVAA